MIISHDRKTLFIGVPKNGSQTARAVLGQLGVDLVGEMGRHPTVPEAIRLAEAGFHGEVILPTATYAFWRDPVERFCSAVAFHKRCLPNSFIQMFPERFVGIEPHPKWFETDPEAIALDLRSVIGGIRPAEILAALPPPTIPGISLQPRGGNLSFYRHQAGWLDHPSIIPLSFADYEIELRQVVDRFGGDGDAVEVEHFNSAAGSLIELSAEDLRLVQAYYWSDFAS
jgi:hypothetical protein